MYKNKLNSKSMKGTIAIGVTVATILAILVLNGYKGKNEQASDQRDNVIEAQVSDDGDLVIPVADITQKANLYSYEVDGTKLEVMAVKASDGTIRTAFNTCQVCYSSGRGFYEQKGDYLVCQNCGNRFKADEVEVSKGGCNPVPIFDEDKTIDETNITVSKEFLKDSKLIFENWKL